MALLQAVMTTTTQLYYRLSQHGEVTLSPAAARKDELLQPILDGIVSVSNVSGQFGGDVCLVRVLVAETGEPHLSRLVGTQPLMVELQRAMDSTSSLDQVLARLQHLQGEVRHLLGEVRDLKAQKHSDERRIDILAVDEVCTAAACIWNYSCDFAQFDGTFACTKFNDDAHAARFATLAAAVGTDEPGMTVDSLRCTANAVLTRCDNMQHMHSWAALDALVARCVPLLSEGVAAMTPAEAWTLQHYAMIKGVMAGR